LDEQTVNHMVGTAGIAAPSLMFYSHDTYGLGHLRRTLALASFLRSRRRVSQLIVTGSPVAYRFALPPDADFIKLPSVVKVGAGAYESRSLDLPFRAIRDLRRDVLLGAARHFRPKLLVVDNVPAGLKGELLPTLRFLKASSCRLVLGLRDVIDDGERIRTTWANDGSYELLDDVYDRILVYGVRDVYDPVAEYGFSERAAAKTRFVGYLRRGPGPVSRERIRALLGVGGQTLVLVTAGGGEDGYELLRSFLEAIRLRRNGSSLACVLVGGPLMPPPGRRDLRALAAACSVAYIDFVEDITSYVQAADVVVSMGGYNSVCELLSLEKPALIVPRVSPRREQLIRARALSRRGLLRMIDPGELQPRRLLDEVTRLLEEPPQPARLPMNGLEGTAGALDELLAEAPAEHDLIAAGGRRG
jgi:predicted glycosyltransferase